MTNPIIFIGTGRSGSTYISGAILSHKDLAYPSNYIEKFPSLSKVNRIRYLFDNKFWRLTTRGNFPYFFAKSFFLPSESYSMWRYLLQNKYNFSRSFLVDVIADEETKQRVNDYFVEMVKIQGKKELGFKITGPSRIGFLLSIFPDAKFVWVKRDLVPTVNSFLKVDFWKTRGYDKLWFNDFYTKEEIEYSEKIKYNPELITAFQLKKIEEITYKELNSHNPKHLILQYEDFLNSPDLHIREILDFLELSHDEKCFDYIKKNPVRMKSDDGKWIPSKTKDDFFKIIDKKTNKIL